MKFSLLSSYLVASITQVTSSAWELRTSSGQIHTGTLPQTQCQTIFIPRGAQISWNGSKGAATLQLFDVPGKCNQVYRIVIGAGEINASNDIYAYFVKP
ncbi:hypothetical protein N7466_009087 [Penicillium verhagenii]|uniref:uncharacterized protein n=1 Tax=Penicillium verhagenii TaxID=1562060 RepID=UPI0025451007|nr:uncharacterized protein N7466_009087 [Penicillium verhagenii]KAJ5920761.1 hypothetical protein N7466_009087 [Penicillium verhagenii]